MSEGDETAGVDGRDRHEPGRLLALTDGVFAISMTLLALDVRIPEEVEDAGFHDALGPFLGHVGVFFVAFLITSRFWLASHHALAQLRRVDYGVLERSILFLFGICAIPVATSVLFRFGNLPEAVAFAALVLAGTAVLSARLWWYLTSPERGLSGVDRDEREEGMIRLGLITVAYLLAIPVAYLLPAGQAAYAPLTWVAFIGIDPAARVLQGRLRRRRERRAAA